MFEKINQKILIYFLIGVIIVLVVVLLYFVFYKAPFIPTVSSNVEVIEIQKNISKTLADIRNTLQQINQTLGR